MKKIIFITPHYWGQKRRTGFYWIANAFHQKGYQVLFFTSPISLISVLNRDHRFQYPVLKERHQLIEKIPRFFSYIHFTILHKVDLSQAFGQSSLKKLLGKFLSLIFNPLMKINSLKIKNCKSFFKQADAIVFESSPSLELFEKIKNQFPKAKLIYRVSDDLRIIRVHPETRLLEKKILHKFDLVSVPYQEFKEYKLSINPQTKVIVQNHGLIKDEFDKVTKNPYIKNEQFTKNVIFVGIGDVDYDFLNTAFKMMPQWLFHIIGPLPIEEQHNVKTYGEIPFMETIAYIKFADIGLQCRSSASVGADTLKIIQYGYCGLPVIAPDFLKINLAKAFFYQPQNRQSIHQALIDSEKYANQKSKEKFVIGSWSDIADYWDKKIINPQN